MSAPSRHTVESLVRELLLQQVAATPPAVATSGVAPTLLVNSSARHMHISPENLAVLFGPGAELTVHKWLYQEGQFVIRAARHVHMSPDDAKFHGVKHLDKIGLRVTAPGCTTVFDDLIVRVDPTFKLEVHIDTDEANACDLDRAVKVELISR